MRTYIGTKIVTAAPQEKDGKEGYAVFYPDGYTSWSPKDVFEEAYRVINDGSLTFGLAIEALKKGYRVARKGWNGKGMWLSLSCDGTREVDAENFWSPHNAEFARQNGGKALVLPAITMKTVDSTGREAILMGWLASQTDMLSEDWVIVEGN